MILRKRAYARAGLLGNPSDGYFGKTISVTVKNFSASVELWESPDLHIELSDRDKSTFKSIDHLRDEVSSYGYYAGLRLLKATVKRFGDYCEQNDLPLPKRNFTVRYHSNIPRHIGLGGSSAIITAFLRALMEFYGVEVPLHLQPTLVLGVETDELDIGAGLQDRVIQAYEGMVYMDFDEKLMRRGYGNYEPLDPALLPPLFLAYRTDLCEGSEVFHNHVRERWSRSEKAVVSAMTFFAGLAAKGRKALIEGRPEDIGPLMDQNFDRRAKIYPISERNQEMVQLARDAGAHAKFSGSGGAVIGVADDKTYTRLRKAYGKDGFKIVRPRVV